MSRRTALLPHSGNEVDDPDVISIKIVAFVLFEDPDKNMERSFFATTHFRQLALVFFVFLVATSYAVPLTVANRFYHPLTADVTPAFPNSPSPTTVRQPFNRLPVTPPGDTYGENQQEFTIQGIESRGGRPSCLCIRCVYRARSKCMHTCLRRHPWRACNRACRMNCLRPRRPKLSNHGPHHK